MIIDNTEVYGFEAAIRGMRNPLNSWSKSDSLYFDNMFENEPIKYLEGIIIGSNDLDLAQRLIKAGTEHSKFLRFITVWADIDMPRYWWSEFDTYHYNSKNSCSTMHKLLNKETPIELGMFVYCKEDLDILKNVISKLNNIREQFINSNNQKEKDYLLLRAKRLLPEGLLQRRTVITNYAELRNIYHQRKKHRLKEEWQSTFCEWVSTLPYANELIIN